MNYSSGSTCHLSDEEQITSYAQATACDSEKFKQFFHLMLEEGVYLAPSAFEAGFLSTAHTDKEIELTLAAADKKKPKNRRHPP